VKLLPDTHILLWAAGAPGRLPHSARELIDDPANALVFSVASIWEMAIKANLKRGGFAVDVPILRRDLLDSGYTELGITSVHAMEAAALPPLHGDPFDRVLIAQARLEGLLLLTADKRVAAYPGPIRRI
jgi:PIN domain nuclease of toxin-antitoxin system